LAKADDQQLERQSFEVSTPRLDAWVRGSRPVPWTSPEAMRASLRAAMSPEGPPATPEEALPERTVAAWRLVRATALWLGIVAKGESLEQARAELGDDPWTTAVPRLAKAGRGGLRETSRAWLWDKGLPLLPPEEPERLGRWVAFMAVTSHQLGITPYHPHHGAVSAFLDLRTARGTGVSGGDVLAFEELAVDEAHELLVEAGERALLRHFRGKYHLSRQEVVDLVMMGRARARELHSSDIEENRALLEAQLKDYLGRAKESMNMADELRAMRELARVQGLTRVDPDDLPGDFLAVVARVSGRQDAVLLAAPGAPALPPPRTVDAEVVTSRPRHLADSASSSTPSVPDVLESDPADAEALAEFDVENRR